MQVSTEDKLRRSIINRILCHAVLVKSEVAQDFGINFDEHFANEINSLKLLERDGLVNVTDTCIEVTPLGRIFIRNVAMVFDAYLKKERSAQASLFSRTL